MPKCERLFWSFAPGIALQNGFHSLKNSPNDFFDFYTSLSPEKYIL